MSEGEATVFVGGEKFEATSTEPFVFGRTNNGKVVGLDPTDMGISAEAGSIEFQFALWWVINRSRKRHLLVETNTGAPAMRLDAGDRVALTRSQSIVLVPGAVFTHRLDIQLSPEALSSLQVETSQGSGTITIGEIGLSERDRDVLTALFSGYLRPFPYRDARPISYQGAADVLGSDWTKVTVRKQVERIKERMERSGLYFQGLRANDEMAEHLIANGMLTPADLFRLEQAT